MKKARSRRGPAPTAASLRAIPEIDVARFEIRRNRFAARVQREGIELVHEGPSAASLAEILEVNLATAARRLPASRRLPAPVVVQIGKGRPRRGDEVGPTTVRSVRLPAAMWRSLEQTARRTKMTVHGVLRTAIVSYLERPAGRSGRSAGTRASR